MSRGPGFDTPRLHWEAAPKPRFPLSLLGAASRFFQRKAMERTRYRELRARLKSEIEAQHRLLGYVSLSPTFMASICGLRSQDVEAVWQTLVKEFNLELDGAGYNSWAPAGQQISKEHVDLIKTKIDALKKKVSSSP